MFRAHLLQHSHGADGSRQVEKRAGADKCRQARPYVQEVSDPGVRNVVVVPDVPSGRGRVGIQRNVGKGGGAGTTEVGFSLVVVCRSGMTPGMR